MFQTYSMFPDSQIAAKYSQEDTKSKYVAQFGLAVLLKMKWLLMYNNLHTPLNLTKL